MINRKNWKLSKKYLKYRGDVDQLSNGSLRIEVTYIRYLLEWAGENPFRDARIILPALPEFLLKTRLDGRNEILSGDYIKKVLSTARRFFRWLSDNKKEYRSLNINWLNTLKPKRIHEQPKKVEVISLEQVIEISKVKVENAIERRIRAAAVFWFLSGIRIGAFVSLPLQAVDIENREIKQFPSLGVRTKYQKYAVTYLLPIAELITVIREWDEQVRKLLPESGYWFAPLSPRTGEIDTLSTSIGAHRQDIARKNLRVWLCKAGLKYYSPHKFRHAHIHYGIKNSAKVADFKAVSINVMHENMKTTDEIYSRLIDSDVRERIESLGDNRLLKRGNNDNDLELFKEFLDWRERTR